MPLITVPFDYTRSRIPALFPSALRTLTHGETRSTPDGWNWELFALSTVWPRSRNGS